MHINLLPSGVRLKIQFRGALRRWRWIWISAAGCALVYFGIQLQELLRIRADLVTLEERCEPLRVMQAEMNREQEELTALLAQKRALANLQTDDHLIELLGVIARAGKPLAGRFQLTRLGLLLAQPSPVVSAAPVPTPAPGTVPVSARPISMLSLHGIADNDRVLASFVSGLRNSGVFEQVDLKSSSQSPGVGPSNRSYQLDCKFEN